LADDWLDRAKTQPRKLNGSALETKLLVWHRRATLDVELEGGSCARKVDSTRQKF
jgi:hypothetical protein